MRSPSHPITIFYCVLTILLVIQQSRDILRSLTACRRQARSGSKTTMKTIDVSEAEQLVVKAMDSKDPAKRSGGTDYTSKDCI